VIKSFGGIGWYFPMFRTGSSNVSLRISRPKILLHPQANRLLAKPLLRHKFGTGSTLAKVPRQDGLPREDKIVRKTMNIPMRDRVGQAAGCSQLAAMSVAATELKPKQC
jgi:hypothetical protein